MTDPPPSSGPGAPDAEGPSGPTAREFWSPPPAFPPPGAAPLGPGATPPPPAYGYSQPYGTGPTAGYGSPYGPGGLGGYGYPPRARTNGNAIASLVCGICSLVVCPLVAIAGLVTGLRARRQIRDSGGQEQGDGLAIAGLVISGLGLLYLVGLAVFVAFFITLAARIPSGPTTPTTPIRPFPTSPTSLSPTSLSPTSTATTLG